MHAFLQFFFQLVKLLTQFCPKHLFLCLSDLTALTVWIDRLDILLNGLVWPLLVVTFWKLRNFHTLHFFLFFQMSQSLNVESLPFRSMTRDCFSHFELFCCLIAQRSFCSEYHFCFVAFPSDRLAAIMCVAFLACILIGANHRFSNRGDAKVELFLRTTSTTRQVTWGASPSRVI